jgi:phytoene dehydrogenase-like protein
MTRKPFVVVGGGLAGLVAAIALADKGHEVSLFERSSRFGGRAHTQLRKGFAMNFGPHALYLDGPADSTFRRWGIRFSGTRLSLKELSYLIIGGEKRPVIDTLADAGIATLLTATDPRQALGNFDEWLAGNVHSQEICQLLCCLVRLTTFCAQPEFISARAALQQMQLAFSKPVWYLDGGWGTLVEELIKKARSLKVHMETNSGVENVYPGLVCLVSGRTISASGTILATGWEGVDRLTSRRLLSPVKSRMALLDLGLRRLPEKASHWGLGVDSPFYLSVHSVWASLAPPGAALVHVGKYLRSDGTATRNELEEFTDLLIPGWRKEAEVTRFLPNMVANGGVITLAGRPDVSALKLDGIAICGDWVGPEGMLADASVSSALQAAAWLEKSQDAGCAVLQAATLPDITG